MKKFVLMFGLAMVAIGCAIAEEESNSPLIGEEELEEVPPPSNFVIEGALVDFSLPTYRRVTEEALGAFEDSIGKSFEPGKRRKVGIKVYASSGPGLSTPEALVESVIQSLLKRGFLKSEIFILGMTNRQLRSSGFLPPVSVRSREFRNVFVRSLESGQYYSGDWFYDNPLPAPNEDFWRTFEASYGEKIVEDYSSRKSFLPLPLMFEVDFWINLPCYTDHPVLGVNGALTNATLWNASNTARFLSSPATAPVAVAEIGSIPELRENWTLNIVSLERYQYIGGPIFNSLYTVSEPRLFVSDNPVMLDAIMLDKIDANRLKNGFQPLPENLKLLVYAEQLGLGAGDLAIMDLKKSN